MAGANPLRGEAELGDHKIIVDFNGWCIAEPAMGATMEEILGIIAKKKLGYNGLRTLIRAFLNAPLSPENVGELIVSVGIDPTTAALTRALEGFFSSLKEQRKNPPKAG